MKKIFRFCFDNITKAELVVYVFSVIGYSLLYIPILLRTKLTTRIIDDIFVAENYDLPLLIQLLATIIGLLLLRSVLRFFIRDAHESTSQKMRQRQREHLYDVIQAQDMSFFKSFSTGDLIARISSDLDWPRYLIAWLIPQFINDIFTYVLTFIYLAIIDWRLTLILAAMSPLFLIFSRRILKAVHPMYRKISDQNAVLNKDVQENLAGNRVVRAYAREAFEIEKFQKENKKLQDLEVDTSLKALKYSIPIDFLSTLMAAVALIMGGFFAIRGNISIGQLTAFVSLAVSLATPLRDIVGQLNNWTRTRTATDRVLEVYEREPKIFSPLNAYKPDKIRGEVEFDHVTFTLEGTKILDDVSFHLPPGQTVAIMGPTGSGKTFIINLILRLYDVDSGRVLVDGVDVRDYDLATLRHFIGVSTQDVFLFSETIEGNISYGAPNMSMDDVYTAARRAQAFDFIRHTSDGFDTIIGERGVGLSGGQKQRLALARALAIQAPVLILDDTTSALDMETEAEIQKCLREYYQETTQIIIAQRISSVRGAERILILEDGKITEDGTHDELVHTPGYYQTVYRLQNGEEDEADAQ